MTFMAWPEIEAFYNIRKYSAAHPEILNGNSVVHFKPKVKLHGTNAAIQVHSDKTILVQSRETFLSPEKDNAGFAKWVMANAHLWGDFAKGHIVYGEFAGPGIQRGVALNQLSNKIFAVFAARPLNDSDTLITEPDELLSLIGSVPNAYVLPWYNDGLDIDWSRSADDLKQDTNTINEWVAAVEANDPWVKSIFNIDGTGEGLVFYPTTEVHLGFENFKNLVFKAKGEKHKNIATAKPAQVNPEVAASVEEFCSLVLTEARLNQAADKICNLDMTNGIMSYEMKHLGKFIAWVSADVEKEAQDELAASNLTFKQVQKVLTEKARAWYMDKAKR